MNSQVILPGQTIGMVGGGQLGRMFAIAAAEMGYRVGIFCGSTDEPACDVAAFHVCGPLDDRSAIETFARQCDVITLEFENIPAETIAACSRHAATYPSHHVLAASQDRFVEKSKLAAAGLPVTPFEAVDNEADAIAAGQRLGWPIIAKTRRSGYDGKGQHRLHCSADARAVDWQAGGQWIAEAMIDFEAEASVLVARNSHGQTKCFPTFENLHVNHVLDKTILPAQIDASLCRQAEAIAIQAAELLDVVGLLCVEFFIAPQNGSHPIMINEVAPRPHNSGHVTIEANHTSQFQQHVRAVCGLPLGDTAMRVPAAAMVNLLGDVWGESGESPDWASAIDHPGVNLHLYGKHAPRRGRKMGHLTATGESLVDVQQKLDAARDALKSPPSEG